MASSGGQAALYAAPLMASSAMAASPLSSALTAFSNNAPAVGVAWIASSAILTTYSATKFLKYDSKQEADRLPRVTAVSRAISTPTRSSALIQRTLLSPFQDMSRPARLTLYRFAGSFALGLFLHTNLDVLGRLQESLRAVPAFVLPALLLFAANLSNSIALDRIGIPLTYTSKCAIPLTTVLITVLMDGPAALPSRLALLSLLPIAVGIAAASWSAPTFQAAGLAAAMGSTLAQSALNVHAKRTISRTGVGGPAAQRVMVGIGLVLTVAVATVQHLLVVGRRIHAASRRSAGRRTERPPVAAPGAPAAPPLWLSSLAFTAYHIEYVLSFMFVRLVQPVTYGTCDAVRRLAIILAGKRMFGGAPLTRTNWYGIVLALLGALGYSIATSL